MKTKKLLSLLLAIVVVFSMMATMGISAAADEPTVNGTTYTVTATKWGGKWEPECPEQIKKGDIIKIDYQGIETSFALVVDGQGVASFYQGTYDFTATKDYDLSSESMGPIGYYVYLTTPVFTLTYNTNGGSSVSSATGTTIVLPETDPTKSGCTFDGWYIDSTLTTKATAGTTITANTTLYAKWTENQSVILDLDENTTEILDNKQLDQNYNLAVNEGDKTNATKVKLSWEIKDINATRTDNKVWDTTELKWVTASSTTTINQVGSAKFTLENYSSVMVDATATFKAEGDFKGTASYDVEGGKVTLDTANGNDTYSKTNVPTKVINATITTAADDFKTLDATTKATKYGTYTVTLSKNLPTSFVFSGFYDEEANNAKINGMTTSAFCQYMVDNGMIDSASEFGDVLVKYTYYNRFTKTNATGSRAMSLLVGTAYQEYVEGADVSATLLGDNDYPKDKSFNSYFNGTFTWDGSAFVKNS